MATEYFNDALRLYQATVMVLSGQPDKPVDVLFFHNRSFGDYTGLFEIAGEYSHSDRTRFIAVTNNEGERFGSTTPFEANPGMTECIRCLVEEQYVPIEKIIPPKTKAFHTRQENHAFLELARQQEWKTGLILAQPHQLLRSMLGMLQIMEQSGYMMAIYTATPNSTPWQETVKGNQGLESKPRVDHISDELDRIFERQASGELASLDQLIAYLEARDKGTLLLGPIGRERFKI